MKKLVTITNMTGARNGGCEALVASIADGVAASCGRQNVTINLDSADAVYDARAFEGRIDRVFPTSSIPKPSWSPAAQKAAYATIGGIAEKRGKGSAAIANLRRSDLLIATGGDVFTSDYGGLAKHARTLAVGRPVALLAQTLGPFSPAAEDRFRKLMSTVVLCTVRESETLAYLQDKFPELNAEQTADVAFLLPVTSKEESRSILEDIYRFPVDGRKLVGLSVSSGILSFRSELKPEEYLREIAAFVDHLNAKGYGVVLIPHVQERDPRNNDIYACLEVMKRVKAPQENVLLSLTTLSASDYKGIIGLCDALVGARTHATIASMSQGIPTVSIAYSRKAWGIMRDYYGQDLGTALTIDVANLTTARLIEAFDTAISNGSTVSTAEDMKCRAYINFDRVKSFLHL